MPRGVVAQEDGVVRPPSILLILTDDQRADALGCARHPVLKTPVMDRLASEGVRFANAFVTTPICAASRATILSGRYEARHGFTFGTPPLAAEFTRDSWPVLLRRAGWVTGHVGKWGLRTEVPAAQLFDHFVPLGPPYAREGRAHLTDHTVDRALEILARVTPEEAFALTVSFNAPHAEDSNPDQYIWPPSEDGLYDDVPIGPPPRSGAEIFEAHPPFLRESLNRVRWGWRFDTPEKQERMTRGYYRMISGVDRNIGRLLEALEAGGRGDTIVVLLGDNGYFLGERGFAGKWLVYEESIRVPFIVFDPRTPASARGRTLDAMALNLDLGPTLLELVGVAVPGAYQGKSLAPLLAGREVPWRDAFLVEHHFDHARIPKHRGVRGQRWVYDVFYEEVPAHELLFDLESDPEQLINLAGSPQHARVLQEQREELAELLAAAVGE